MVVVWELCISAPPLPLVGQVNTVVSGLETLSIFT